MKKGTEHPKSFATIAVLLIVVVSVLVLMAFSAYQKSAQPLADYWILNVSINANMGGYVTPNGTIHVPLNQTGITVTATPTGWNGFICWKLDGAKVANHSSTIFVPKQQANSTHILEAQFVIGTPPIFPVFTGNYSINVTIEAGSYKSYNFTVPSDAYGSRASGKFFVSGGNQTLGALILDSTNFMQWENTISLLHPTEQNISKVYNSGEVASGTLEISLPSAGTYFIIFDNTLDAVMPKTLHANAYFYYFPK